MKYLKLWLKTTLLSLQTNLVSLGASLMYIVGKLIRFTFFIILLFIVIGRTRTLSGYNINQLVTFFLIFNLLDILGQLFFRGIYWFKQEVVTGKFDLILVKPANPLFLVLTTRTDILDLPLLIVVLILLINQNLNLSLVQVFTFLLLFLSGLLIITAIHILVACVGVITTEVDHLMWIYRDLSLMARVPIDIYLSSVRVFLTFLVPIALIFTFPAKALLGMLSWPRVLYSILFSFVFFLFSLKIWNYALKHYSSASS